MSTDGLATMVGKRGGRKDFMHKAQVRRVIVSLAELYNQSISVHSISTKLVPSPEDPDFLDPVVVIKYQREDQDREHEVHVYVDGSASDF